MACKIELGFDCSYEFEVLSEIPPTDIPRFYYPGAVPYGGKDGVIVKISPPRKESWLGTFAFGQIAPKGLTGVFSTPNVNRLCVVSKGNGYLVSAGEPQDWESIKAIPIIDARSFPKSGIIVFAHFTGLVAYGDKGIRWKTERLSWDNLKIISTTEREITGEFWDIRSESTQRFVVDLVTGNHSGGISQRIQ